MQVGRTIHELWGMKLGVAVSLLLGVLAGVWSVQRISLSPPGLEPRTSEIASASTQMLVDTPMSSALDLSTQAEELASITDRALLLSNLMASAPVRQHIARHARVDASALQVAGPVTPEFPRQLEQSDRKPSTSDILRSPDGEHRLSLQSNPTVPLVSVYAQASTATAAKLLADGAVTGTQDYLRVMAAEQQIPPAQQVTLRQLGRAEGGVINDGVDVRLALLSFLLVFAASCLATLFVARVRRGWRATSLPA
jgi:hypothetical protein